MNHQDIWSNFSRNLETFFFRKVRNREDARDLAQDVLVKIFQRQEDLGRIRRVDSWVYSIARNALTDYYRKSTRVVAHGDDLPEITVAQDDTWDSDPEIADCVLPFINELEESDKNLLYQVEVLGIDQKELAGRYGVPYSTLKSRVQRARVKVRALFTECCTWTKDAYGTPVDCWPRSSGTDVC